MSIIDPNKVRSEVLNILDTKLLVSMTEINEHLKSKGLFRSYQTSRRTLLKMVDEGLVFLHPQRQLKNSMMFTKAIVSPHLTLTNVKGEQVDLTRFIASLYELEMPPIISEQAAIAIRSWMFDYIVGSDPSRYKGIREAPNREELKKKLEGVMPMLSQLHAFIKHFISADIHSPVAKSKLARELNNCPDKQIEFIVTRRWMENDGSQHKEAPVRKVG